MSQTHTFLAEHALKAVELRPDGVLVLSVQKTKKVYKCVYLDMTFKVGNLTSKGCWFKVHNIMLVGNVCDSAQAIAKYTKGDPEKSRLVLTSSVSNAGVFGKFLEKFGPIFAGEIQRLNVAKEILVGKRTINTFIQDHVSDESNDADNRGNAIEDPIIRFVVSFDKPAEWIRKGFPWGKTITQFFDYASEYQDADNKTQYKSASVKNEETGEMDPIDATNLHKYATSGSFIKEAVVYMRPPSLSSGYVSSKIVLTNCIFEQSIVEGMDTAEPVFEGEEPVVPTVVTPVVAADTNAVDDLISAAMGDMNI